MTKYHPRRLLGVFARPDDESFCAGGTFARSVAHGAEVMVVSATRALVCTPEGKVAQRYPLVPGVEFAGTVVALRDQHFASGDEVLASDFGSTLGISRHGDYSEYARVPAEMRFPLSNKLNCKLNTQCV